MKTQDDNSKVSIESQVSETSMKKEWNEPDIKVVVPVNRTASGVPGTGLELGGYTPS